MPTALAQQATPTPAPAAPPTIITLPDTGTGSFSLGPARATPAPTPAPVATQTTAASPVPRPAAAVPARRRPELPVVSVTPAPTPAATSITEPAPTAVPTSLPTVAATSAPVPAAPAATQPPLRWALLGAAATGLAGLAAWLLLRRRRPIEEVEEAEAVPALAPVAPAAPRAAPAPVAPPCEPFELGVQPLALQLGEREVVLDLELLIANRTANPADAVRISTVMISANADQDAQIAAFQANSQLIQATDPFDLTAGAGGRMPVRLTLPREHVHVVTISGRPMFVPLVMIAINWRGGLAVRRFGASFMIGAGGQGGKLGPIWLDRPRPSGPLTVTRYLPHPRDVAA